MSFYRKNIKMSDGKSDGKSVPNFHAYQAVPQANGVFLHRERVMHNKIFFMTKTPQFFNMNGSSNGAET
jgi:hypothetical protein